MVRSARSPPTNTTRAPSARSASATASAGTTCPAVPPAAITIVGAIAAGSCHDLELRAASGGDVQQEAHAREQHGQVGRAVGDERQRHAGQRREAEHGEYVQARLRQDQRRQAGGEELRVRAGRPLRDAQPGVREQPVEAQHAEDAGDAELLADDREDEVGVGLGEVEDLLHRLADPPPEEPARPERDLPCTAWNPASPACAHGSRNVVSRARRYGSLSAYSSTSIASAPAPMARNRIGMPAATSSAVSVNASTSAVPRSGCEATSRIAMPAMTSSGMTSCGLRIRPGRWARSFAPCRTSASLAISDGWNCSGPAPSHRRAPLTLTPRPGTFTASRQTNANASSAGVSRTTLSRSPRAMPCMATSPSAP